jgi:hypothetical protein
MKHIKYFKESVINLSKNRKFPDNFYDVYKISKQELGNYLNTWFPGEVKYLSDLPSNKVKLKRGELNDCLLSDEVWTVKKVDEESATKLYGRYINPISISIRTPFSRLKVTETTKGEKLYDMKVQLHSVDDSQFGISWCYEDSKPLNELKELRENIMKWINSKPIINGQELLDYCVSLGANKESIDYN